MFDFLSNPLYYYVFASIAIIGFFAFRKIREIRQYMNEDMIRAVFVDKDAMLEGYNCKKEIRGNKAFITVDGFDYEIVKDRTYHQGPFRIPTLYYQRGRKLPIKLGDEIQDNTDNTTDDQITIGRALLGAFARKGIQMEQAFLLGIIVTVGVGIGVYYLLNQKLQQIEALIMGLS